jgi:iron complex outermembrane receptor protein
MPDLSLWAPARTLAHRLRYAWLPLLVAVGLAQDTGRSIIEGRVLDQTRGNYLNNARVTIEGTVFEAFTDQLGLYRFTNLPAGEWRLKVFYTGLGSQVRRVTAIAGQTVENDFFLTEQAADDRQVVKLDAFVVASTQETNQSQLAINEQRFAPNFTNVVAVDEFGITSEGNVGEFVKFLPGVQIGAATQDARDIGLGGMPSAYTPISMGGISLASAASSAANRTVELEQISITNLSRIEINKSPVPDQRADAIGGSVNLIPKSAFERTRPEYRYRLYFTGNDSELLSPFSFAKVPGRGRRESRPTTLFAFEVGGIVPVSKNLGFTFSLADSNRATAVTDAVLNRSNNTAIPANSIATTPDKPYVFTSLLGDGGSYSRQRTAAVGVDFKLGSYDTFKVALSYSYFDSIFGNNNLTYTLARVVAFTPDSATGAVNAGTVTQAPSGRSKVGGTFTPSVRWFHRGPVWTLDGAAGISRANNIYEDVKKGFLQTVTATLTGVTIALDGLGPMSARTYTVSRTNTATGEVTPVNQYDLANYTIRSAATAALNSVDLVKSANLSAKRTFNLGFPLVAKVGSDYRQLQREIHRGLANASSLTFVGPDKIAGTADDVATAYLDEPLAQKPFVLGQPAFPWINRYLVNDTYQQHPDYFTRDLAAEHRTRVTTEKSLDEAVTSGYVRLDAKFLENRLNVTTGARWERTAVSGSGNLIDPTRRYQRDANGNLLLNAAGAGIVRPEFTSGTTAENNLAIVRATYLERGATSRKTYADYYPSLNLAYNITTNLIARASYASTLGRPNLSSIIPGINIPEPSVTGGREIISFTNTDLKPWTADNYALGLEYYFDHPSSGSVSVRGFRRNITNFFLSRDQDITPEFLETYGLDEASYGNAIVRDTRNSDVENRLFGLEFAYSQNLGFLPAAIGRVRIFGNATLQRTTPKENNFSTNLPRAIYNWGVSHQYRRLTYSLNWNYRGRLKQDRLVSTATNGIGPGTYTYEEPRLMLDGTLEYLITRHLGLFIGAKSIPDTPRVIGRYGPATPDYARVYRQQYYGASYFWGVRGSF